MMKRALAIAALSLSFVWPAAAQTPPVINGQTGAVTISPQTLDWLRQRLAEEEERLRQLQIAIQQVAREVAASQTAALPLVPTPAETAIPSETAIPTAATTPATETGIAATSPIPANANTTTTKVAPHPPLIPPPGARMAPPIASRPPLIPAPLQREIGPSPATSPLEPIAIAPIPVTLSEPVATIPSTPEPSAAVSITPPPVGPAVPSVTIVMPSGTIPTATPAPGAAPTAPAPSRPPKIYIPTLAPNRAPSAPDPTNNAPDSTGSPVVIPPNSDGDDLVIPEGIISANPAAQPQADSLRSGQSMAEVRRIKGTPALISRDDAVGSETWTYPDGTLVFRSGRLSGGQIASAEVPQLDPVSRRAIEKAPIGATPARGAGTGSRPAPRIVTNPREVPSLESLAAPDAQAAPEQIPIINRVAGIQQRITPKSAGMTTTTPARPGVQRTASARGTRTTTSRQGTTVTTRRHTRTASAKRATRTGTGHRYARTTRWTKAQKVKWARTHRRNHRTALRNATPRVRVAAINACRKCRIARAYLYGPRRTANQSRVAAWRGQTRTKSTRDASKVTIIQRK
jgi:hypothetical protein